MKILDPCCGSKMSWLDKDNKNVLFGDKRIDDYILCDGRKLNISPDVKMDFKNMPFKDMSFSLVIFDPPHLKKAGKTSWLSKKYGTLPKDWQKELTDGFNECWRVLNFNGTLIFKWNETQIKLKEIINCFPEKPLFGHTTTQNLKTHWIVFFKWDNRNG